jgi:hypothetical protein
MITPKNLSEQVRREVLRGYVPAANAGDADKTWPIGTIPYAAEIKAIRLIPQAAITGADTNTFTAEVYNGATKVASQAFTDGNDAAALTALGLTLVTTAVGVTADAVVTYKRDAAGNGLAQPELVVEVEYEITDDVNKP